MAALLALNLALLLKNFFNVAPNWANSASDFVCIFLRGIMKNILVALITTLGLFAEAKIVDKIIGDDDLVLVTPDASNIPLKYRKIIDAFGMVSPSACTATHIGNGYVLTAGHCFWATAELQRDQDCSDTTIQWGRREDLAPYVTSQCEKVIVQQTDDLNDFAIIKVSPAPPVSIAPDMSRRAVISDTLTVFSHPNELPLHWSKLCGVERLSHEELPPNTLQHKCDTNPGSSGATLINVLSLKIVGIHDGGINGFLTIDDPQRLPINTGMNYGTFIMNSPLYEVLKELGFK